MRNSDRWIKSGCAWTTVFSNQAFETWSAGTQTSFGLDVNMDRNNCKGKKCRDKLKGALLRLSLEGFSWILERFKVEGIDRKIIAFFYNKNMHGYGSESVYTAWWARSALQRYCTENWEKIFPERKLRHLSPNFYIYITVSDLYIPTIGLPIWLQQIRS